MNIEERNALAKSFISDKLDFVANCSDSDFTQIPNFQNLKAILLRLINVKPMGFRGVVATAITGKFLNQHYNPLIDFYACNPRSIFEQGIFYAFENRIPCGKSDPLNVAKNINVLDYEWAKGKRPQSAAQAAVDYLRILESVSGDEYEQIVNFFFYMLSEYAKSIASITISLPETEEVSSHDYGAKLVRFVLEFPESGTVPQLVVSAILNQLYRKSEVVVEGGLESVFGTNTTSKKPADIWLERLDIPYNLFEITVKKIDFKRLDDCLQSLNSLEMLGKKITFICRIPEDTSSINIVTPGSSLYKGKYFNFVDISSFIFTGMMLLSDDEVSFILSELRNFVSLVERPVKTKEGWNLIFS